MNNIIICEMHGVSGAVVEITTEKLAESIAEAKQLFTKDQCRKLHKILKTELTRMLPMIAHYKYAVDSFGEFYDTQTFDDDLVLLAVYDHIGNGKKITLLEGIEND